MITSQRNLFVPCLLLTVIPTASTARGANPIPVNAPNAQAVEKVRAKKRTDANAAWWGFDPDDATKSIQAAIDSGAKTVVIPYMGRPWIIRPITLRSAQKIIFEPGVLILAKKGEFTGGGDSLFRAVDQTDITLHGYGAVLRMRKHDYQNPPYKKAEWRMGLSIVGCKRIRIEGLRIESTGGDGIYLGATGKNRWCEDITIRNVICHDNHRQGISVISAQNLLIENCILSNTSGTSPEAGIDLEPNRPDERLVNCVIRNCVMSDNHGNGISVYLMPLSRKSEPVSIRFENCITRMGAPGQTPEEVARGNLGGAAGVCVGTIKDDGPTGLIEFRNCVAENTGRECAKVYGKSADSALVRFVNCSWRNPWIISAGNKPGLHAAVLLHHSQPALTRQFGGVEFVNCAVFDAVDRPVVQVKGNKPPNGIRDITGDITVFSKHPPRMELGANPQSVNLRLHHVKR